MTLEYRPYPLLLKHPFGVAGNTRTQTPDVQVIIRHGSFVGHGEASMPPYLGETTDSVLAFLQRIDLSSFQNGMNLDDILQYIYGVAQSPDSNGKIHPCYPAIAALDMALHDIFGQMIGQPLWRLFGLDKAKCTYTTFTIGIDKPDVVRQKVREVDGKFGRLKVKVGVPGDRELITTIREVTDIPLTVDANQGWTDPEQALQQIEWLSQHGVIMIEQPLPKNDFSGLRWLTERSPLPIILDESIQGPADVLKVKGYCHGINIKLMKCGGLAPARLMIQLARMQGMQVMLGCMTETRCAVTAAAQLAPCADFLDLDGNLLITNDPFNGGMEVVNGIVTLQDQFGLGIYEKNV